MCQEIFSRGEKYDLQEDTLSLCDLQLDGNSSDHEQRENDLPTDHELFQFFNGFDTELPPPSSQDIIFCGKILSYNGSPSPLPFSHLLHQNTIDSPRQSRGSTAKALRTTHSLNHRKPNCQTSSKMSRTASVLQNPNDRKPASKWFKKCDTSVEGILASASPTTKRPKWQLFLLGFARAPAEMELKDIRSRQSRLSPPDTLFPSYKKGIVSRDGGKACWSLLGTLSCKRKVNRVMMASLGCISGASTLN